MAMKSIKLSQRHENTKGEKDFWPVTGNLVMDETVHAALLASGSSITYFPSHIPGAAYTGKAWPEEEHVFVRVAPLVHDAVEHH